MASVQAARSDGSPARDPWSDARIRTAVVGCGAISSISHLPAIARSERLRLEALVDTARERAERLAEVYSVPFVTDDFRALEGRVEAAVIALPNHLHAPVTIELLRRGIHVLVEKPMALSSAECDAMIAAAESSGAVLAVGLEFRFFGAFRFVREVLVTGLLGGVTGFDLRLGLIFNWPVASDYLLHRERAGGGVLIDFGVHTLDLLLWWLGPWKSVAYADDAKGGVEANAEVELELKNGAFGKIELSRTRNLRNTCVITGELGCLQVALWVENPRLSLEVGGRKLSLVGRVTEPCAVASFEEAFSSELTDFAEAIRTARPPYVGGAEGRKAIELIETCYRNRRPLKLPWEAEH
ncbi:MAG TPA: Gfo/Idh/MocA family oxidoreductase [Candidatus Eisenbacteria bacterium]|nr:Gfo/Idh/MocA family oxidoreductase [Candidatus Eisenbacteria bacterium]